MPVFEYKVMQGDSKIAEGQIEADGRQQAFRQIEAKGLRPIRLVERGGTANTTNPDSPSNTSYILAWVSGGLFDLDTNTADLNGLWTVTDFAATNAQRFYRIRTP